MEMMLQTQNLCKYFKKQKAVNNVSLNIEKKQIYGLLTRFSTSWYSFSLSNRMIIFSFIFFFSTSLYNAANTFFKPLFYSCFILCSIIQTIVEKHDGIKHGCFFICIHYLHALE
jgi:ribosome-associated toxin RatA of RatAB toxin-antitoxin module